MTGEAPVWLVDGSFGQWQGADQRVKSLWVLSRDVVGELIVTGSLAGASTRLMFQADVDGPLSNRLHIQAPDKRSVVPGVSSSEVTARYTFVPSYMVYPSPGCWSIDVRLGAEERRIVVEQRSETGGNRGQSR